MRPYPPHPRGGEFFSSGGGKGGLDESTLALYIIKKIMCKDGESVCIRNHHRDG